MIPSLPSGVAALLLLAPLASSALSAAQNPQQPFRSDVELVSLPVTVEDSSGRAVTGLTRDDFSILEDGVRHEIAVFSNEPQPIALAVLVDFSRSMQGERRQAAVEAVAAIGQALDPQDRWSLFAFADRTVQLKPWGPVSARDMTPLLGMNPSGGTRLFEGVIEVHDALRRAPHRKRAILVISDGNDISTQVGNDADLGSMSHLDGREKEAVNALRRGEALAYAFGMDWPYQQRPTGGSTSVRIDRRVLRNITEPTGGKVWMASTGAELKEAARLLTDELRQQYTLGYSPTKPPDGKYRRVRVTVTNGTYRVRSRQGYLARRP